MKKLKLQLDDLRIDSFDTTAPQKAKGTVFGEQCTCYTQCTCPGCPTCDATCGDTCGGWSCGATCNQATCGEGFTCLYWYTCENTGCSYTCNVCGTMNTDAGPRGECHWCP